MGRPNACGGVPTHGVFVLFFNFSQMTEGGQWWGSPVLRHQRDGPFLAEGLRAPPLSTQAFSSDGAAQRQARLLWSGAIRVDSSEDVRCVWAARNEEDVPVREDQHT